MVQRATLFMTIAYPLLIHLAVVSGRLQLALIALLLLSGLHLAGQWRAGSRGDALLALSVFALTVGCLLTDSHYALFLPPVAISLGLLNLFGSTLTPGREALISRFARLIMRETDPQVLAYTRRVTQLWTGFFAVMAVESVALAMLAPLPVWSLFTNILNYLFIMLIFVAEFGYRRMRFPQRQSAAEFIRQLRSAQWRALFSTKD